MGYDVTRFQGDVDEDLICPICSGVLEEPVQVSRSDGRFGGAVGGSGDRKYSDNGIKGKSLCPGSPCPHTHPIEVWCKRAVATTGGIGPS